jgi:hypothetical protein
LEPVHGFLPAAHAGRPGQRVEDCSDVDRGQRINLQPGRRIDVEVLGFIRLKRTRD